MKKPKTECSCDQCVSACRHTPGWFLPGEAEKAAALLCMPFEEFKSKYLIKDHCSAPWARNAPYVLSPRKDSDDWNSDVRSHVDQGKRGSCIFLKDNRCQIHAAKPFECRKVFGCDDKDRGIRNEIEDKWIEAGAPLGMRPERD